MSNYTIYTDFKEEFVRDFQDFNNLKEEDYNQEWKALFLAYTNARYQKENNELLVKILDELKSKDC